MLDALEVHLRQHYPHDAVGLRVNGKKRTRNEPESDLWAWTKHALGKSNLSLEATLGSAQKPKDVCIHLKELCVVEADGQGVADSMEARFPALTECPAADNASGRQYYFARSQLADEDGYYGAADQVIAGVAFKTRLPDGTAEEVVVGPDAAKTWRRAPWEAEVLPIPDELLRAVAQPRHAPASINVRMVASDESFRLEDSRAVVQLSYADLFLGQFEEMPVPRGNESQFRAVLAAVDAVRCNWAPALGDDDLGDIIQLADFLGAPQRSLQLLRERGAETMRLRASNPRMAAAVEAVDSRPTVGAPLVEVDQALVADLTYEPHPGGDVLLLRPKLSITSGSPVLMDIDLLRQHLPRFVQHAMRRYPGKLMVAGGFVTGVLGKHAAAGSDIDLFVVGCDEAEANVILEDVLAAGKGPQDATRTDNAVTFHWTNTAIQATGEKHALPPDAGSKSDLYAKHAVQIVLLLGPDMASILHGFDLEPCKVGAVADAQGSLHIWAAPSWVECMRNMAFPVRSLGWAASTSVRVLKYAVKGFQAYLPGRLPPLDARVDVEALRTSILRGEGMLELLKAERAYRKKGSSLGSLDATRLRDLMEVVGGYYVSGYGPPRRTEVELSWIQYKKSFFEPPASFFRRATTWRRIRPGSRSNGFEPAPAKMADATSSGLSRRQLRAVRGVEAKH